MTTKASTPIISTEPVTLPDGEYKGHWGGYVVDFEHEGRGYRFQTKDGIRTPNAPCVVTIAGSMVTVQTVTR